VKSPNPAFADVDVPLASTFMLSTKAGKEAWVEPVILPSPDGRGAGGEDPGYRFTVRTVRGPPRADGVTGTTPAVGPMPGRRPALGPMGVGADRAEGGAPTDEERIAAAKNGTKLARGANFQCVMSGTPIAGDYIKAEGTAGRLGARLMAIVAEGNRGRVYLAPTAEHEAIAQSAKPEWKPDIEFFQQALGFRVGNYGMTKWSDLFTDRQLVALATFATLAGEAFSKAVRDAASAGLHDDGKFLRDGGTGATAYAEAIAAYLGIAVARYSNSATTICSWNLGAKKEDIRFTFSRQALQMTWDFAEGTPFSESSGNISDNTSTSLYKALLFLGVGSRFGTSVQADATGQAISCAKVVSADPPYYDNIGYADLSDFFYISLRRSLRQVFPDLFETLAVPKFDELVATPRRHGGREEAEAFFLSGMARAMRRLAEQAHPAFPVTIYYAFKQSETEIEVGTASTGWETFLDAVIRAGFGISGTWPMRTERQGRSRGIESNALASSIVLVCRPRAADAPTTTRRELVAALKAELPVALSHLQRGNIAPVDLAQAAIGPGMAVYTRYEKVLDAEGKPLSVREALALINQTLDEALAEQEGDFDADTRWALAWFEQSGFDEGEFGVAEVLSKAKVTSVAGMVEAGILASNRGKVRLLRPDELRDGWDPSTDARLTVWEMVHHLVRALDRGEAAAADLVAQLGSKADTARELAYRLYTLCERKKRAAEALAYNALVQSWPELARLSRETASVTPAQGELL
jgi:putative DNA methylase